MSEGKNCEKLLISSTFSDEAVLLFLYLTKATEMVREIDDALSAGMILLFYISKKVFRPVEFVNSEVVSTNYIRSVSFEQT